MLRLRLLGLASAVLLLASVSPSLAAAAPALVLRAGATSETVLVLTRPAVLDVARTTVSGPARVGGLGIFRLGARGDLLAAELRVPAWDTGDGPLRVSTFVAGTVRLPAGRYRLVVFADRPVTVIVPLRAGVAQSLTATRRTTARAELTDLLAGGPVVPPQSRRVLPYGGVFVLSQTWFRARAQQAEVVSQCFAPAAEQTRTCVGQNGFSSSSTSPGSVGDGYTAQFAATYGPVFAPGEPVDVLLQAVDVDVPAAAGWLTVTA